MKSALFLKGLCFAVFSRQFFAFGLALACFVLIRVSVADAKLADCSYAPAKNDSSALAWLKANTISFPPDDYYAYLNGTIDPKALVVAKLDQVQEDQVKANNRSFPGGAITSCIGEHGTQVICVAGARYSPDRRFIVFGAGDPHSEQPSEIFVVRVSDGAAWRASTPEERQDVAFGSSTFAAFDGWPTWQSSKTLAYIRCQPTGRYDVVFTFEEPHTVAIPSWLIGAGPAPHIEIPQDVRDGLARFWAMRPFEPDEFAWNSSISVSRASGDIYVVAGKQAARLTRGQWFPIQAVGVATYYGQPLGLEAPYALTTDSSGNLFAVLRGAIVALDPLNGQHTLFGGRSWWDPNAIGANPSGDTMYIADPMANVIYRLPRGGQPKRLAGACIDLGDGALDEDAFTGLCRGAATDGTGADARFNEPSAVAVDASDGIIFVADTANNEIRAVRTDGSVSTLAGQCVKLRDNPNCVGLFADGRGSNARFFYPTGIAYDDKNRVLYVADKFNRVVRRVTLDGVVTTVAGNGIAGYVNGSGTNAEFCLPSAIAYDPLMSRVLVYDSHAIALRQMTAEGLVSTLSGYKPDPNFSCT